jgi:hypothetical protein
MKLRLQFWKLNAQTDGDIVSLHSHVMQLLQRRSNMVQHQESVLLKSAVAVKGMLHHMRGGGTWGGGCLLSFCGHQITRLQCYDGMRKLIRF